MSLNLCQFIGRLQNDPVVTDVKGKSLKKAVFSIAVENHYKDSDGHRVSHTEWVDFIAWGNMAIIAGKFLKKGSRAYFSGKMQTVKWVDKTNGQKKKRTQVSLSQIQFLDKPRKKKGEEPAPAAPEGEGEADGEA